MGGRMKRIAIAIATAATAAMASAWSPASAQEAASGQPFQCTVAITDAHDRIQLLTAGRATVEACKTWAHDAGRLEADARSYELVVHDGESRVVFRQACASKGLILFGPQRAPFVCKDVAGAP
jgi:hypothetical protein